MKNKEIAKFATGVVAWESLVHASFLMSGSEPVVFGITLTTTINIIQTIIPAIIAVVLGRYAWRRKETA